MSETSMPLSCEQVRESLLAYSLGAAEAERAGVDAHLSECAACAAEAAELVEACAVVADEVPQASPPPSLRARLLAAVEADASGLASRVSGKDPAPDTRHPTPSTRPARPWLGAAAAVVAVAALVWAVALQVQFSSQQASLERLTERHQRVLGVLQSPNLQVYELGPTPETPGSWGRVILDPNTESGMLMVAHLPPLSAEQAYQVWFVSPAGRKSGGLVRPDEHGRGYFLIEVPRDLAAYQAIGLTEEPATGSDGPTGRRVLGGQF